MLTDESKQQSINLTLKGYADDDENISRGAFLSWRKKLYQDEAKDKQTEVRHLRGLVSSRFD